MKSEILAFNDTLPQFEALNISVFGNSLVLGTLLHADGNNVRHFD